MNQVDSWTELWSKDRSHLWGKHTAFENRSDKRRSTEHMYVGDTKHVAAESHGCILFDR
jgi:hypothetical protein